MLRDNALLLEALIQYYESQQVVTGNLARSSNRAGWRVAGILEGRTREMKVTHFQMLCCLAVLEAE